MTAMLQSRQVERQLGLPKVSVTVKENLEVPLVVELAKEMEIYHFPPPTAGSR